MSVMLVTFAKDMAPYVAGESRLVPSAVEKDLRDKHLLSSSEPWPRPDESAPAAAKPEIGKRITPTPHRPVGLKDRRNAR